MAGGEEREGWEGGWEVDEVKGEAWEDKEAELSCSQQPRPRLWVL